MTRESGTTLYRQVEATPGADADPNEEDLNCSLAVPPPHYDGFTYCSVPNGYWGRSHGNDEGTPPDNFKRAAVGVYPAGGRFDDSSFGNVGLQYRWRRCRDRAYLYVFLCRFLERDDGIF